ncbi:MAG: (2Fe-2S)-binding protein [Rhodospirillales bacterium]|nr:(2Fe-2S)-binding protein [Rhodospirillales bacterium]
MSLTLHINGETHSVDAEEDTPLLWVIRDDLDMTGTKFGCGVATRSCQTYLSDLEGSEVITIEGAQGPVADAVQQAWRDLDVVQCGYCQSGQILSAISLLSELPKPGDADIDAAMGGNACRCATYQRIRAAIHRAAAKLES